MSRDGEPAAKTPALRRWLLLCAGLALWIDLGSLHRLHHADSLLPVLMSLMRWTPFFWEQDRFGMPVPLLAMPLAHPLANLLFQDFLDTAFGLSAFLLLARFTTRDETYPAVAAIACGSFLALSPPAYRFSYLVDACYGVWMAPGLAALILTERDEAATPRAGRRSAAIALAVLAHWVNFTASLFLAPLAITRFACLAVLRPPGPRADRHELVESLIVLAIGSAAGLAIMTLSPYHSTQFGTLPLSRWPNSWGQLAASTWRALEPWGYPALLGLLTLMGVLLGRRVLDRDARNRALAVGLATIVAALVPALFIGTRQWAETNTFPDRYWAPSVIFASVGLAAIAASPLKAASGRAARRALTYAPAAILAASAAIGYGFPSISGVRRDLDARLGARTNDLLASRCTHVSGDYWNVWTSVFHARLVRFERGESTMTWGITHRCDPTRDLWMAVPLDQVRVGIGVDDPAGDAWLKIFHLPPFVEAGRLPTIRVLRPASAVNPR